jgi:hypothetical protein
MMKMDTMRLVSIEKRRKMLALYGGGLLQGIALIMFPAASPLLTSAQFHGLGSEQFGLLFTPQILAVSSYLTGPGRANSTASFSLLLLATGAVGVGFGFTIVVGMGLAGLGLSFFYPLSTSLASSEEAPALAAAVLGTLVAAIMFGMGFSAGIVGTISRSIGLGTVFNLSSFYAFLMAGIVAYLLWSRKQLLPRRRYE